MREQREKREKLEQERERETTQLKEDINRLSKELSDNKVCVRVCIISLWGSTSLKYRYLFSYARSQLHRILY